MKILIAGDFCPQERVAEMFDQEEYGSVLGGVRDVIACADYSIVNFECPVTKGGEKPIEKCGPNLKCSEKGIEAVKWAGFDCVTLANNHFLDYGQEGAENTIRVCKKNEVDTVGGGMNLLEASKILYREIKGETLAIINCCEHEFSIATETTAGSNPLSSIKQYYAILEARKNSDYVLVIVHGGHEHYQLPSPRMQDLYRFFIDVGADAVVNHHQHCFSGYEIYNGKPIFYGIGNFCFDHIKKKNDKWNEGFLLEICFSSLDSSNYEIYPYTQCDSNANVELMDSLRCKEFEDKINFLNSIILDDKELSKLCEEWMDRSVNSLSLLFQPYKTRIGRSLYSRNFLPSLLSRERILEFKNYIFCESHLDRIINYLQKL